ncbi:MAG: DUF192 domain-containing protein [Pseudomonadota bacterium]|nr:DUF192 domain-containing protein [Pseudomonadota bacterium]
MTSLLSQKLSMLCAFLVFSASSNAAAESCKEGFLEIKYGSSTVIINVEIADTPKKRHLGLMHREKLALESGMLFIYDKPSNAKFWMKNTVIPLDIAFADAQGLVKFVKYLALPNDLSIIEGGDNIKYVVEVEAGTAKGLNLSKGAILRSNRFGSDVLWPC